MGFTMFQSCRARAGLDPEPGIAHFMQEEIMSDLLYVGKNIPRTIEVDKVTGRAIYVDDLKRPGMLYGKILYSNYA
ncbi:MAG: hypothetical protein JRI42_09395, partial [Deltaproteobacteria bacterium]|nr:hypothetical protein [Deltaproteobacteria bacterium]